MAPGIARFFKKTDVSAVQHVETAGDEYFRLGRKKCQILAGKESPDENNFSRANLITGETMINLIGRGDMEIFQSATAMF